MRNNTEKNLSDSLLFYVKQMSANGASKARIYEHTALARLIEGYQNGTGADFTIKTISKDDFISFGYWLKNEGEYSYTEDGEMKTSYRKEKSNSSVVKLLRLIQAHIRSRGIYHIQMGKVERSFPFKSTEISLDEDIVDAILKTDVAKSHRHYLDAIKLIILHGFRYSDLWMLRKKTCIKKSREGFYYFHYFPAKNYKSKNNKENGVTVPVHPLAKPILDYWADKNTASWMDGNRAGYAMHDKEYAPHIVYRDSPAPIIYFKNPIIKIPHYQITKEMKEKIFTKVQNTWYIDKYGVNWDDSFEQEGLMREVFVRGKAMKLYETFTYHFFRHVYCTRYIASGGNLLDLKENVGHSDIKMTMRYLHDNTEDRLRRSFLLTK